MNMNKKQKNKQHKERINQRENHTVGYNIKRLRIEQGLKNSDIICLLQLQGLNISSSTYYKIEAGYNNPTVDMLRALAHIYHCNYDDFFRDIE